MGSETGQIQAELATVFHEIFDEDIVLTRDLTADQVEGWDSMAHVRLLLTIERKFKVRISPPEAARLKTVGDLVDLLERKCAGRP